jgi:hypothetical protein
MSAPAISKLSYYSLGIVAANKSLKSHRIEVTPIEEMPMLNGEINDERVKYTSEMKDAQGTLHKEEIDTSVTVNATWVPISNSNRRTPPDVRRGEIVVIYRFADTDQYWWNTLFNDSKLRRLETVIYAFSDNSKENIEDTADSTYYLEVSTHRKIMHIHTSKSDGEPFAYDIQINAKEGIITITDDVGNYFVLNSRDTRILARNADNSLVDINKTNITLHAEETIKATCKDFIIEADSSTDITAKTNTVNGDSNTINGKNNRITGPTVTDAMENSVLTVDGIITTSGVNSSGPVNAPNNLI